VQLILHAKDVPACKLSMGDGIGARLGWNTWLLSRPLPHNAEDVILEGKEVVLVTVDGEDVSPSRN